MKREIKFRGKRCDTGEWIYGNVHFPNKLFSNTLICPDTTYGDIAPGMDDDDDFDEVKKWGCAVGHYHRVITESVGQFTGLLDKNGKEIYEGDIVKEDIWQPPAEYCGEDRYKVVYSDDMAAFVLSDGGAFLRQFDRFIEVIGNIYENPEPITNKQRDVT